MWPLELGKENITKVCFVLDWRYRDTQNFLEPPGTPNNQFKVDVWWNNHFPCKDLDSSNWNNLKKWLFREYQDVPGISSPPLPVVIRGVDYRRRLPNGTSKQTKSGYWVGGSGYLSFMASQPFHPPFNLPNQGLVAGLIQGNQWQINPDHKALFRGGTLGGEVD